MSAIRESVQKLSADLGAESTYTRSTALGAVRGVVFRGQQLGRTLGYPTANVPIRGPSAHRFGVYATRSRLADGRQFDGVANIGCNPTTGLVIPRLEVFLFGFDEDIYGQVLETELIAFLRPELKFEDIDTMVLQIQEDEKRARMILASQPRLTYCDVKVAEIAYT